MATLCTQTLFTKGVLDFEVIKKIKLVHLSVKMMPIIVFMPLIREPQERKEGVKGRTQSQYTSPHLQATSTVQRGSSIITITVWYPLCS